MAALTPLEKWHASQNSVRSARSKHRRVHTSNLASDDASHFITVTTDTGQLLHCNSIAEMIAAMSDHLQKRPEARFSVRLEPGKTGETAI